VKSSRWSTLLGTMGVFVDWVGLVGGSIATIFSWTAFNRDSFADNVVMRQNQVYQQKNYHISWVAIARDDIRDMMGISVNRINNYMLVATLMLAMSGGALTSFSFSPSCPGFLMHACYVSIGISIMFLVLSIMFGVAGQNMAFCETMDLLTFEVRPENPDTYSHDYMNQAQWIEKQGLRALFRIPGMAPERYESGEQNEKISTFGGLGGRRWYKRDKEPDNNKPSATSIHAGGNGEDPPSTSQPSNGTAVNNPEEQNAQQHTWYLHKFRRFMELWQPFETWSKYSMSLGILSFGHGLAYWSLGKLTSEQRPLGHAVALVIFFPYIYVVTLIAYMNLGVNLGDKTPNTKTGRTLLMTLVVMILVGGPVANGLSTLKPMMALVCRMFGGMLGIPLMEHVFVFWGYILHFVFWLLCFITTFQKEEESLTYQDANKKWKLEQSTPMFQPDLSRGLGPEESGSKDDEPMASSFRQRRNAKVMDESADTSGKRRWTEKQSSKSPLGVEGNAGEKWIVDDDEFGRQTRKKMRDTQTVVELAIGSSALIWASMCIWVVVSTLSKFDTSFDALSGVHATRFSVDWPDPLFKPGQMACVAENKTQMKHIFVANRFSIYSLQFEQGVEHLKSSQKPIKCGKLEGEIIDMSALCDDYGGCRPFVLIRNDEFTKTVDCARPEDDNLLKWRGLPAPNFIEVKADGLGLIVKQNSSLVIWTRTNSTSAWVPQYDIGIRRNDLSDIDYGFGEIVFFRNVRPGWFQTAIEQFDAKSMEQKRAWRIPQNLMPLAAGCMMQEGVQALVLPSTGRQVGSQHYLTRLDFNF